VATLVIATLAGLVAGLPARWALLALGRGAQPLARAATGTVWQGSAPVVLAGMRWEARWRLAPLALLVLEARADLELVAPGATLVARAALRDAQHAALTDASFEAQLGALAASVGRGLDGLDGTIALHDASLVVADGRIASLACAGTLRGLALRGVALGDLDVACADEPGGPTITLRDRGGPLALEARIGLAADGRYLFDGHAAARPGAAPALVGALPLIGAPAEDGGVRIRYAGALPPLR
jgi:hypothetical protein